MRPLWSSYVWFNEVVNALYETVGSVALMPLMGTPFISPFLRMMGCKIGRWVFLETTLFSEFDLVKIEDRAALNLGATIQTHLFEDRVMKADFGKDWGWMLSRQYGGRALRHGNGSGLCDRATFGFDEGRGIAAALPMARNPQSADREVCPGASTCVVRFPRVSPLLQRFASVGRDRCWLLQGSWGLVLA